MYRNPIIYFKMYYHMLDYKNVTCHTHMKHVLFYYIKYTKISIFFILVKISNIILQILFH